MKQKQEKLELRLRDTPEALKEGAQREGIWLELEGPSIYHISLGSEHRSSPSVYFSTLCVGATIGASSPVLHLARQERDLYHLVAEGEQTGITIGVTARDIQHARYERKGGHETLSIPATEPAGYELIIRRQLEEI